jgi:hypothetical protein
MHARVRQTKCNELQLTLDPEAALALAASVRFAGRFHETVRRLSEQIAQPIENAVHSRTSKQPGAP